MRVPLDAGTHARTHVGVGVHIICVAPLRYHMRFSALLATRSIWVSPMLYITHTFIHARARARAHTHFITPHQVDVGLADASSGVDASVSGTTAGAT